MNEARPSIWERYALWVYVLVLAGDVFLNFFVISRVNYTEIDWKAYMQEVAGVVERGSLDYMTLEGDTGPIVYPAGFVYVYAALYYATQHGTDIVTAQAIFAVMHTTTVGTLLCVNHRAKVLPVWSTPLLALSRRIHSIYVLRLFNDCVAMLLLYSAMACFVHAAMSPRRRRAWRVGAVVYSMAVGVKMNILLFAPGVFFLFLNFVNVVGTVELLGICAAVQVVMGLPFLYGNAWGYIARSFNFGRVFMYKWTVNLRFLSEEVFISRETASVLLGLHVAVLILFIVTKRWYRLGAGGGTATRRAALVVRVMMESNFVGIVFCRTLHYQFYVWYFHTLPFLLWICPLPSFVRAAVMVVVEVVFNIYPPRAEASIALWASHLAVLLALLVTPAPDKWRIAPPRLAMKKE